MPGLPTIEQYSLPDKQDLPRNVVPWTLDPDRAALLVHDMQGYFLDALPTPLRQQLVHNASLVRKECAAAGVPVAYTAQPGRMTDADRGLLKDFWGPGMRTSAADREVVAELAPADADLVLTKWRYSAFFRTNLLAWLREQGRDQLIICGVYAHVGVLSSAVDAFTNDIQPFLVADATADFSAAEHDLALTYTARRCGKVVTTEEVFG